ncbi:flavin containing amine oxidoreductase family protein [Paraburkholderia fungorum]|uniref:FAD-dependent monooxygenase n=1 Tax=Paraburkholderia fungorum TaxID=134537 RepID=A0AAP1L666_9BURK|nr:FAD-dependent monooxygenase [Paraburkholderia fungorum]AJZ56931.1 flavin containing amine oxidoreductase family protein [Paraburkholderia fungorum]MBB4519883.1 salicylate hydroxylase [Paraburkholderia fungorum]MDT8843240.1 FAD-dependent monooxygenase [Paraburkholderia fungorum]
MSTKCRIAIVGGGLAGTATANALKTFGVEAELFEAAPSLGEIGAAVSCSPQAVKALWGLGARERVDAVGHRSPGEYTRNMQTGEFLEFRDRFKLAEKWGAPYYSFHRADLLDALASTLDSSRVHLGHRVVAATPRDDGVELAFDNGHRVEAQYVIGSDGVKSVLRQALYGDDNPSYTGQMAWRSLLDARDVPEWILEPTGQTEWVGPGAHVRAYYIRQKKLVNIVTQQDTGDWVEESWNRRGDPDEMRASFANPEPRLKALLDLVADCMKWGLFARPINDNWGHGRIQLIGDAAHAMVPNAGQGACQAFEDAYILGRWLSSVADPEEAFRQFRRVRIPRVHGVQRLALANLNFKHMKDTQAQKEALATGKGSMHGKNDWLYGFDPATQWDQTPVVAEQYADAPAASAAAATTSPAAAH